MLLKIKKFFSTLDQFFKNNVIRRTYSKHSKNITDVYIQKFHPNVCLDHQQYFHFINKNLNARLLFLGYWMIKI